jgi:outer membrane protein assembly factor BamB
MAVVVAATWAVCGTPSCGLRGLSGRHLWLTLPLASAQEQEQTQEDRDREDADTESGVFLPTDRLLERRLDFARRLVADARWSDAATLLDEILAADRDAFFRRAADASTWESAKVEAARLVGSLPAEGRTAYELQFRARAERMLQDAIASGDKQAISAVARRWLNTPAGRQATLLSAIAALDDGQPLAAAAWLDRLDATGAAEFEPMLSVMRAFAWQRAGDSKMAMAILEKARTRNAAATRIGGRETSLSFPPGGGLDWLGAVLGAPPGMSARAAHEWCMNRGDPSRNAITVASRPLLVPRFRVPLTRHPDEAKWLEERRQRAAEQESPLLPAATPLAVDGTVILHTSMGLLAVDFETGKRLWLQTGGAAAPVSAGEEAAGDDESPLGPGDLSRHRTLAPVFEDATSGTLSSDGRLVFAVESHPDAVTTPGNAAMQIQGPAAGVAGSWSGGNSLAAYDLAEAGRLRWRLPAAGAAAPRATPWTLGAPLPVGDRLFALVEESGEVRLDVIDALAGGVVWSQPLAELDEEARADNRDNQYRRVAGLSPALSEGVLVCPTGAGAVVAVDLATRTLLWAYNYPVSRVGDVVIMPNGVRVARPGRLIAGRIVVDGRAVDAGPSGRWLDACPVLANGRAVLSPGESEHLHCVDLRSGQVAWKRPRQDGLYVAGVVDRRVLIVGRRGVEALSLENGDVLWSVPLAARGAAISGRCLLDQGRMFVPLDTPEVVEIELTKGEIVGHSTGRGGAVPGNLVAYRGEVLSQAADSLDVFHQAAPLQSRIETASTQSAPQAIDPSLLMWRGQLQLDGGRVTAGLEDVQAAVRAAPDRFPPDMLAESIVFAMERDASVAGSIWPALVRLDPSPAIASRGLRRAIDGLLQRGDISLAWQACRHLLELPQSSFGDDIVADGRDQLLKVSPARWIQGRVSEILARGNADVRGDVEAFAAGRLAGILRRSEPSSGGLSPLAAIDSLVDCFGRHPVAVEARRERLSLLTATVQPGSSAGDAARSWPLRREFALLDLHAMGTGDDIRRAQTDLARARASLEGAPPGQTDTAWPIGRVDVAGGSGPSSHDQARVAMHRTLPLVVESGNDSLMPGLRVEFDLKEGGLVVRDGLGRRLGQPITLKDRGFGLGGFNTVSTEVSVVGRVAVIRAGATIAAYEIGGPSSLGAATSHRQLWSVEGDHSPPLAGLRRGLNRRFPRDGSVPLGMPIPEPDPRGTPQPEGPARISGVPIFAGRSLQLLDPISGSVIWERHRLPEAETIFGDHDHLCVCPADGRGAVVISMATGRLERTCDLPNREQRLLCHGRRVFAITPQTAGPGESPARGLATLVNLDAIDPVDLSRVRIGAFSGEARATRAGDALAILEPSGTLTVVDLPGSRVAFTTQLPDMPRGLERLIVIPWQDRFLVVAGREKTADEARHLERIGTIGPLPQMMSTPSHQPLTGSIWAVDRRDGQPLWQVPATVLHHCLASDQPSALPILIFARQIETRRGGERPRLSVLCLDKRTGAAVHVDDTIMVPPHMLVGCDVVGDPDRHLVSLLPVGAGGHAIDLRFTGEPSAPRPPFQATSRPVVAGDIATELEYWWNRLLTLPLPF